MGLNLFLESIHCLIFDALIPDDSLLKIGTKNTTGNLTPRIFA